MVLPAFMAIVLLASILSEIIAKPSVQHIFWGVGIGVITLLYLAVKEMWKKSVTDKFSLAIYFGCLILALFTKVSLALIIIGAFIFGILWQKFEDKQNDMKGKE